MRCSIHIIRRLILNPAWFTAIVVFLFPSASAQITPDQTLGDERSHVTPARQIRGQPATRIEGGATRGTNLFHSFEQFNVGAGQAVYFGQPEGIRTILSRVTGRDISDILGTLGVEGTADLFLLNPNGIIFGPNARLDISGSFVATTADRFTFPDGSEFGATNPQAAPLLTVNVPIGIQYGANSVSAIRNRGILSVGEDLTLSADHLDIQGQLYAGRNLTLQAQSTLRIRDRVARPLLAGAGNQMLLQAAEGLDIYALNHPQSGLVAGGDLILRSSQSISGDAHYWSGDQFRIEQLDGQLGNLVSLHDPVIRSVGDVSFNNYRGASLHILAGGSVTVPGRIIITGVDQVQGLAENVTLSDGTIVPINGAVQPTLDIRAGIDPAFLGSPVGIVETPNGFFQDTLPDRPVLNPAATSADISIYGIYTIGAGAADGLVLLTNQYHPNRSLPGGTIGVHNIITDVSTLGVSGNSGAVIIDSRGDIVPGLIGTSSTLAGAGNVMLIAEGTVFLNNRAQIFSTSRGPGNSGNVTLRVGSLSMANSAAVLTVTLGPGDAGDLTIIARDAISLTNQAQLATGTTSYSANGIEYVGTGAAGNIQIDTGTLSLQNLSAISAVGFTSREAGNLVIRARGAITLDSGSTLLSSAIGDTDGGEITIETQALTVAGGSGISSLTLGRGNAGRILIRATDAVNVIDPGSAISTSSLGVGQGGELRIETGSLTVQPTAGIFTSTFDPATFDPNAGGFALLRLVSPQDFVLIRQIIQDVSSEELAQGNSGNLSLRATEGITVGGLLSTRATGRASGGTLSIATPRLVIQPGGEIRTSITGSGVAGALNIRRARLVDISGGKLAADTEAGSTGNGGDIQIETERLRVRNGGTATASTSGGGDAGNLTILNADRVEVMGMATASSSISAQVNQGATGRGGNLTIETNQLSLQDGASISVLTESQSRAGNLWIRSPDGFSTLVELSNGSALTAAATAGGQAGNLTIQTDRLVIEEGSSATVSSTGVGQAGTLTVEARDIFLDNGSLVAQTRAGQGATIDLQVADRLWLDNNSSISASTRSGIGGNLTLRGLNQLQVRNSRISASTATGEAGNLRVDAAESIALSGEGGLSVEATNGGRAGSLSLTTGELTVANNAAISVSSPTGQAGNLDISADQIQLNQGNLTAETGRSDRQQGADIALQAGLLRLENGSRISASAGAEASGGNIAIDAANGFVVASPNANNDIIARADRGRGGNIAITTQGVFGLQEGNASATNFLNDIDASSQFGAPGTVAINQSEVDPKRDLGDLPETPVDASSLVEQDLCEASQGNEFVVTGRGGLPSSPDEPLSSQEVWEDWRLTAVAETGAEAAGSAPTAQSSPAIDAAPAEIIEAQGWIVDAQGRVELVAEGLPATPQEIQFVSVGCQ